MEVNARAPVVARRETDVAAPVAVIWALLSRLEEWPSWNPDVRTVSVRGPVAPGTAFSWKAGPGTITSTLLSVDPEREIGWRGRTMGIPALHVYRLAPGESGTHVTSEESWEGLVVRMLRGRMQGGLERALESGLEHLRRAAEARGAA